MVEALGIWPEQWDDYRTEMQKIAAGKISEWRLFLQEDQALEYAGLSG